LACSRHQGFLAAQVSIFGKTTMNAIHRIPYPSGKIYVGHVRTNSINQLEIEFILRVRSNDPAIRYKQMLLRDVLDWSIAEPVTSPSHADAGG
jgi:hypothetical protein